MGEAKARPECRVALFQELAAAAGRGPMDPVSFTTQGDRVVVEGKNRGVVRSTGRACEHDWVMVFELRDQVCPSTKQKPPGREFT